MSEGTKVINEKELFSRAARMVSEIGATYGDKGIAGAVHAVAQFEIDPFVYFTTLRNLPPQQALGAIQNLLFLAQAFYYLSMIEHFRPGHRMAVVGPAQSELIRAIDQAKPLKTGETVMLSLAEWIRITGEADTLKAQIGYTTGPNNPTQ